MNDDAVLRARLRARCAVALLLVGLVVAFVPGLAAGDLFLPSPFPEFDVIIRSIGTDRSVGTNHYGFGGVTTARVLVGAPVTTWPPTSLIGWVRADGSWAASAVSLLVAPLLFLWWRRSAIGFGRVAGIVCCLAASSVVCLMVLTNPVREIAPPGWIWRTVPLGGALMAAAFLVAPAPRVRDE